MTTIKTLIDSLHVDANKSYVTFGIVRHINVIMDIELIFRTKSPLLVCSEDVQSSVKSEKSEREFTRISRDIHATISSSCHLLRGSR